MAVTVLLATVVILLAYDLHPSTMVPIAVGALAALAVTATVFTARQCGLYITANVFLALTWPAALTGATANIFRKAAGRPRMVSRPHAAAWSPL